MKTVHPIDAMTRQRGARALVIVGSLLIVAGLAGIGFAWMQSGNPFSGAATAKPADRAAAPMPEIAQQVSPEAAAPPVMAKPTPTSGPHPNWHGTWQGTTPDSKMVISALGIEIFDGSEINGKPEKVHRKYPWVNARDVSGSDLASGYAKSSVSLAEISRAYEASVTQFQHDSTDFSISDPTLSRRFIRRIKPGNYRVVWANSGGDCGENDMIIDDDLILSVVRCKYGHKIDLFTRSR